MLTIKRRGLSQPKLWAAMLGSLLLVGCNGTSSNGGDGDSADTVDGSGPSPSAVQPAEGAGVGLYPEVSVTFDAPLDPVSGGQINGQGALRLNAGGQALEGDLSLTDGATKLTFVPDGPLTRETTYTATLLADLEDADGNSAGSNVVWQFTTDSVFWSEPELIEASGASGDAHWLSSEPLYADVAVDPDGNVYVAWLRFEDSDRLDDGVLEQTLWVHRYDVDTNDWDGQVLGTTFFDSYYRHHGPVVEADAEGNIMVVWVENRGPNVPANERQRAQARLFDASSQDWQEADTLGEAGGDVIGFLSLSLAMNADGSAVAVWDHARNLSYTPLVQDQIWATYFDGDDWSDEVHLEVDTDTNNRLARDPDVAIDPDGNALAVFWERTENDESVLHASYYNATASEWDTAPTVVDTAGGLGLRLDSSPDAGAKVAMDASGAAIAVWPMDEADQIRSAAFTPDDGWDEPETLSAGGVVGEVQLAGALDGSAAVAWLQEAGDGSTDNSVWFNRYQDGWAEPLELEPAWGDVHSPQLVLDEEGNAVVTAIGTDDGVVYSARRFGDDNWAYDLGPAAAQYQIGSQSLAASSTGDVAIVWKWPFVDDADPVASALNLQRLH